MTGPEPTSAGPLAGLTVVVCRPAVDAVGLLDRLAAAGAEPLAVPLTVRAEPSDGGLALAAAVADLDRYDWLAVTSANGVRALIGALGERTVPATVRAAAVGAATASALTEAGIDVALVPDSATAADLAAAFPSANGVGGGRRVLAALAEGASDDLVEGLLDRGYAVDRVAAYRMVDVAGAVDDVRRAEAVLLTAPSIVDRYVDRFGVPGPDVVAVCIGPRTAARAVDRGIGEPVVADEASDAGLVAALTSAWRGRSD